MFGRNRKNEEKLYYYNYPNIGDILNVILVEQLFRMGGKVGLVSPVVFLMSVFWGRKAARGVSDPCCCFVSGLFFCGSALE